MRPMFLVHVSKCISPTALLFAGTLAACNTEESAGQPQTDTTVEADAATDGSTQDVAIDAPVLEVQQQAVMQDEPAQRVGAARQTVDEARQTLQVRRPRRARGAAPRPPPRR